MPTRVFEDLTNSEVITLMRRTKMKKYGMRDVVFEIDERILEIPHVRDNGTRFKEGTTLNTVKLTYQIERRKT